MVEGMVAALDRLPGLHAAIARVCRTDPGWRARAEVKLDGLTKPPGSLGRLESIAARLCAIQETTTPRASPRRVVVFAADHGVSEERVSAYPASVTTQMVGNFLRGGAAINAVARDVGASVWVVDVGVAGEIDTAGSNATFLPRRIRPGTRNIAVEPAMTFDELEAALNVGLEVADAAADDGIAVLACGDMGIGNTTAASAITAAVARTSAAEVTGRGTGVDDEVLARKVNVVARALRVNKPEEDPLDVLRTVGGLEIAAIAGACIGAAGHRIAMVGDGFITTAATLVAAALCPAVLDYWFAGHQSQERGHAVQLTCLGQAPLLSLDMRLGEGTGAAVAMQILGAAAAVMNEMATFESAGVSTR